jgi:hypothetical protein
MPTHGDLWIRSNDIRPLWWDRANDGIIDTEQEALSIAVVALAYARELSATERMKRMRHSHKTRGCDRITCISNAGTSGFPRVDSDGGLRVVSRPRCWKLTRRSC